MNFLLETYQLCFGVGKEFLTELEFGGILDQIVNKFDLLLDCLKLFSPRREREWRLLLLLFLLLGILFGLFLGVSLLRLRIFTLGVVLEHLEDFTGLKVTLHLGGEVLSLLEVFIFDILFAGVLNAVV